MPVFWRDSFDRLNPSSWRGLRLVVEGAATSGLSVAVAAPSFIRLSVRGTPAVWARVDDDHWGYQLLRAPDTPPHAFIPPITSDVLAEDDPAKADRMAAWARTYARLLRDSAASPLYNGDWLLGAFDSHDTFELPHSIVNRVVTQKAYGYVQWDYGHSLYPITLRDMSPSETGRVKLWRKHARNDSLPPVLLYWISGLDACVVLDGHDRLLAASIEGTAAPALMLQPVEESFSPEERKNEVFAVVKRSMEATERLRLTAQQDGLARSHRLFTHEDANRVLLDTFSPTLRAARTRACRIPGGAEQWAEEVREALVVRKVGETDLLVGIE